MSRWNNQRKKWLIAKARKNALKTHKKRSGWHGNQPVKSAHSHNSFDKYEPPTVSKTVPADFSLTHNPEETICFINDLIAEIRKKEYKKTICIDSLGVEYVTVDALIYLIAIMQNEKLNYEMKYRYVGNLPLNPEANKVYQESGFMDYVQSRVRKLPPNTDKKKIAYGNRNDSKKSAEFCEFVCQQFNKSRRYTMPLYRVLIELMSNVAHHAYENDEAIANNWYMYAEKIDNRIRFVFVDTGLGIVKTVQKKVQEKVFTFFGVNSVEGEILKSVFLGDFFRTETNQRNRGNGLKTVYEDVLSGPFENFNVITSKGVCLIDKSIGCDTYSVSLHGTLFTFDYVFQEEKNGTN